MKIPYGVLIAVLALIPALVRGADTEQASLRITVNDATETTDSTAPNLVPGFALHDSIADFVRAGFTPMEALQAATSKPAEFLNRSNEQGTIAPGHRADLVLLDANPLVDIHNTQKIRALILKGKYLDRNALDALLNKAAQFAAKM